LIIDEIEQYPDASFLRCPVLKNTQVVHTHEFFQQSAKKNHQPIYKAPLMLAEASKDS
jgi:hypothetical protein